MTFSAIGGTQWCPTNVFGFNFGHSRHVNSRGIHSRGDIVHSLFRQGSMMGPGSCFCPQLSLIMWLPRLWSELRASQERDIGQSQIMCSWFVVAIPLIITITRAVSWVGVTMISPVAATFTISRGFVYMVISVRACGLWACNSLGGFNCDKCSIVIVHHTHHSCMDDNNFLGGHAWRSSDCHSLRSFCVKQQQIFVSGILLLVYLLSFKFFWWCNICIGCKGAGILSDRSGRTQ